MLLELARQLIARAREDVTYPIPMVFNLASWTEKLSLADWLAQELNNLYSVPRKTAPDWVKGDKLILLLDGLDEVRQESRVKCVEAINEFRKEHGLTSLAVCSRSQDYTDLNAKLSFEGAIEVQPLTQEQITEFFKRFGEEMAGIKQVLKKDTTLREIAETPLFLSIMIMAYRDKRDVDILTSGDEKAQRKHLFDTYIERMFKRHNRSRNQWHKRTLTTVFQRWLKPHSSPDEPLYTPQQAIYWLSWLAQQMVERSQTTFYLERIQPNWLSPRSNRIHFTITALTVGLFSGHIVGLFSGLVAGLLFGHDAGLFFGLVTGLFVGLLVGGFGLISGELVAGLFFGLVAGLYGGLFFGLYAGLFFGLLFGLFAGLFTKKDVDWDSPYGKKVADRSIRTVETLHWRPLWSDKEARLRPISFVMLPFIVCIMSLGLLSEDLYAGTLIGLLLPLLYGWFVLIYGLKVGDEIETKAIPNQGISRSIGNAALVGLFFGLASVLVGVLVGGPVMSGGPAGSLCGGLFFGLVGALVGGLKFGSLAYIQHALLHLILYRNGSIPLDYIPFLDHCVDLIFLRRVGGGYIFVHRLLMEHFAEMYVETTK
jgi:MFS family permease